MTEKDDFKTLPSELEKIRERYDPEVDRDRLREVVYSLDNETLLLYVKGASWWMNQGPGEFGHHFGSLVTVSRLSRHMDGTWPYD